MYEKYECFIIQMLYVCVLRASCGSSQFCMTCSSPVSAITERRNMGLHEVHLPGSLLGFGMGAMLANFHM